MHTPLAELSDIANIIYKKEAHHGEIFEASRRLRDLLQIACNKDFMDRIDDNTNLAFDELNIETHIKVYEDEALGIDESSLTVLLKLVPLNSSLQTVRTLHASYVCGEYPGLPCRLEN